MCIKTFVNNLGNATFAVLGRLHGNYPVWESGTQNVSIKMINNCNSEQISLQIMAAKADQIRVLDNFKSYLHGLD